MIRAYVKVRKPVSDNACIIHVTGVGCLPTVV